MQYVETIFPPRIAFSAILCSSLYEDMLFRFNKPTTTAASTLQLPMAQAYSCFLCSSQVQPHYRLCLLKGQSSVRSYCNRIKGWEDFKISAIQMPCKVTCPFLKPNIKTSPVCMVSHPGTKAGWIYALGPTSSSTGVLHRDPHHPFL